MNCLILCSGKTRRAGWKTLDVNPVYESDFLAAIPPLPDKVIAIEWNLIELVHGITTFYPWEATNLLAQIHKILAMDGKLILEQPDFNNVIGRVEWIFGDPTYANPLHMNKWAYTPGTLTTMLKNAGFSRVEILPAIYHKPERDFRAEAYR